jgi:hypothetical protein
LRGSPFASTRYYNFSLKKRQAVFLGGQRNLTSPSETALQPAIHFYRHFILQNVSTKVNNLLPKTGKIAWEWADNDFELYILKTVKKPETLPPACASKK